MLKRRKKENKSIWTSGFIAIFIINFVVNMGQYMMNTLVPKYAASLGAVSTVVGVVSGMFAVTSLLVRPLVGPATEYVRKNRLLAFAIGIIVLAYVAYGTSVNIGMLILARLLHGVGMGFLAPVSLAIASDALPNEKMASGISVFSLGQAISTAVGPGLGIELVKRIGYPYTFYLTAGLVTLMLILTLCISSVPTNRALGIRISFKSIIAREVIVPAVVMFFLAGAFSAIGSFLLLYGESCGIENIGLFFTAYALVMLLSRPLCGKLADRSGLDKVIIIGMLMFAFSYVLLSYSRTLVQFLLACALLAFGYGVCQPSMQALSMSLVKPERRGVAGNTYYIGVDFGLMIAPILAGGIVSGAGHLGLNAVESYAVMYRVMTLPILTALVIFLFKRKGLLQTLRRREDV